MKSSVLIILGLIIALTSQEKKCSPVESCPPYDLGIEETFEEFFKRIFENANGPERGTCTDELEEYRIRGDNLGYPGVNRCFCRIKSENSVCDHGMPQCPVVTEYYKNEDLGDFFERLGKTFGESGFSDGCCQSGFLKRFVDPEDSGLSKRLCYCEPRLDKIEWQQGDPEAFFSPESSESDSSSSAMEEIQVMNSNSDSSESAPDNGKSSSEDESLESDNLSSESDSF